MNTYTHTHTFLRYDSPVEGPHLTPLFSLPCKDTSVQGLVYAETTSCSIKQPVCATCVTSVTINTALSTVKSRKKIL